MKILNTSKQTKRWALISLTLPLTLITFAQAESIQTCQAPVTIAEQGVVSKLRQGANKHRYLDVDINGVTAQAVIDTGGMGIGGLISQALLSDIGIDEKSMTEMTANGAHGASSAKRINIAKTKIANASVENLMFMSTEKNIMQDDNAPVLIGSRFLCQFLVGFNFSNNTLALYDRKTNVLDILEEPKQWSSFPFENFYGTGGIVFTMELNGKKVKAALDTGSPFTGVNWKAARLAGVEKNSKQLHQYEAVAHSLNAISIESARSATRAKR